tara:strand:- start:730 stop:1449 length:720 start_codon:yes stop_codon:yes gene_type:complete
MNHYKKIKFLFAILLPLTFLNAQDNNGMDVFYAIDVSGSYHKEHLTTAVKLTGDIYDQLTSSDRPVYPQLHTVGVIDEFGLTPDGRCNETYEQQFTSMFLAPTAKKESIFKNECLSNVLKRPQAVNTDMFGAILAAQYTLNYPKKRKALFIFSDFKDNPMVLFEQNKEQIDLSGIAVVLVWSDTRAKYEGALSQSLANEFKSFLKKRGALRVDSYSLSSLQGLSVVKKLVNDLIKYSKN